jgi:hypothetical protein
LFTRRFKVLNFSCPSFCPFEFRISQLSELRKLNYVCDLSHNYKLQFYQTPVLLSLYCTESLHNYSHNSPVPLTIN